MKLNFMVAPDFAPDRFAGWHLLNTLLQLRAGVQMHLLMPATAQEQTELLDQVQVDVIYANPFDAASLIRERGYHAFARPVDRPDEIVIATGAESALQRVEDLRPGHRIALTDNRDVKLIGLRLLEAADLAESDLVWNVVGSHQAAARLAIAGQADATFFLADIYHGLSRTTLGRLRVLIESAIHDITHVLLAHPRVDGALPRLLAELTAMGRAARDQEVLDALGFARGFEPMATEDAEFMVDLMDTLLD